MVVAPRFDCRACHAVSAYRSKTVPQLVRLQHLVSSLSIPSLQRACFVTHPVPCAPQSFRNHYRFLTCPSSTSVALCPQSFRNRYRFLTCRSSGRFEIILDALCCSRDLYCMLTNSLDHGPKVRLDHLTICQRMTLSQSLCKYCDASSTAFSRPWHDFDVPHNQTSGGNEQQHQYSPPT